MSDAQNADSESGATLDALLDAAVDAIILCDQNGIVLRFNPAAQSLFGYSEPELLGQNVSKIMPAPYRREHDDYISSYLEGGKPAIIGVGREVSGLHAEGHQLPLHLSVGHISEPGPACFVGIIRDLSKEKATQAEVHQLETHLAHADRLVVLGELTAGIAHEINQPLTAIAAYSDAGARLADSDDPEVRKELQNICRRVAEQARRAGDVVSRLRRLSHRGSLTKTSHELPTLISNVFQLFEYELRQAQVELNLNCETDLPQVLVDEIQIQQVLVNLLKNSLDALRSSKTKSPKIEINVKRQAGQVTISVSDNGPGVNVETQPRLFEPFFTTKPFGVGLGLSICKNIAVAHGGGLSYSAVDPTGACFCLSLPLTLIG